MCFGSKCETGQPELGSETGEWVTREAVGDLFKAAVFMNLRQDKNNRERTGKGGRMWQENSQRWLRMDERKRWGCEKGFQMKNGTKTARESERGKWKDWEN